MYVCMYVSKCAGDDAMDTSTCALLDPMELCFFRALPVGQSGLLDVALFFLELVFMVCAGDTYNSLTGKPMLCGNCLRVQDRRFGVCRVLTLARQVLSAFVHCACREGSRPSW